MNFTITKDEIVSMQSSLNALNVTLSDNQIIRDLIKCRLHREYKRQHDFSINISISDSKIHAITTDSKQFFFVYTTQEANDSVMVSISVANS